ncbi:MAG: DUF2497 domain-containing protein [Xanthobacteraceae bacterium]|nr:DUF2497 domain-containing protein [Xanthobacteraceae bacterium]
MNQPAKAQEPSMEEILASIRRIISDDEAKPAAATAAAPVRPEPARAPRVDPPRPAVGAPAGKTAMSGIPPSKFAPKPAAPPAPPPAAAKNSQDDIDAMLAGFDSPAAAGETEVFELTEQMAMPDPSAGFRKIEPDDDLEFAESGGAAASRTTPIAAPSYDRPASAANPSLGMPSPTMLSSSTATAVESAFNALATTVLSNNARTLEDLVKEMLRPMLKSWLDDNLPNLVERIVKAEIERVARGR